MTKPSTNPSTAPETTALLEKLRDRRQPETIPPERINHTLRRLMLNCFEAANHIESLATQLAEEIRISNLRAEAIENWTNTSAAQHQEIEELRALIQANPTPK